MLISDEYLFVDVMHINAPLLRPKYLANDS